MRDLVDKYSSALPLARATLRILIVLNWLFGAAVLALLVATIVAEQWTFTALGIAPSSYLRPMMMGLRAIAALGVVTVPLNYAVLTRLLAMVVTLIDATVTRFRHPTILCTSMPAFPPTAGWPSS